MQVALITDQHFGARNDSIYFLDFYEKFYSTVFFPAIDKHDIKTVFILGDTFDRRKYVNFYSLQRTKKMFFDELQKRNIHVIMLVGNHDTYFKNTNEVNSVSLLLSEYNNIEMIYEPKTIEQDGVKICMIPWICPENEQRSLAEISNTEAKICMGHFEIGGFAMYRGAPSHEGLDRELFIPKFDMTFSGHYHHKSSGHHNNKYIHYLGNPYELTWQDYADQRGFHLFDLHTLKLNFIPNPYTIFQKYFYNDKELTMHNVMYDIDYDAFKNNYIKIVVVTKTNPYLFDLFVQKVFDTGVIDINIVEDFTDIDTPEEENDVDQAEDTLTILEKYVGNLPTDLNKDRLKNLFKEIYIEALNEESK